MDLSQSFSLLDTCGERVIFFLLSRPFLLGAGIIFSSIRASLGHYGPKGLRALQDKGFRGEESVRSQSQYPLIVRAYSIIRIQICLGF